MYINFYEWRFPKYANFLIIISCPQYAQVQPVLFGWLCILLVYRDCQTCLLFFRCFCKFTVMKMLKQNGMLNILEHSCGSGICCLKEAYYTNHAFTVNGRANPNFDLWVTWGLVRDEIVSSASASPETTDYEDLQNIEICFH